MIFFFQNEHLTEIFIFIFIIFVYIPYLCIIFHILKWNFTKPFPPTLINWIDNWTISLVLESLKLSRGDFKPYFWTSYSHQVSLQLFLSFPKHDGPPKSWIQLVLSKLESRYVGPINISPSKWSAYESPKFLTLPIPNCPGTKKKCAPREPYLALHSQLSAALAI